MHKSIKNEITKWEISILEIQNHKGSKFKVTRRLPEMFVAETRIFRNKKKAMNLFYEWLK